MFATETTSTRVGYPIFLTEGMPVKIVGEWWN
jgi:hypothetical protein